ncbi:MAG: hypothetical protein HRT68_04415 [Flavobacteriaceae bacterium]|nr:hypothetical protein [Flavobacteriaceae bacterium]
MLIQPIVENTIHHGIFSLKKEGNVKLVVNKTTEGLEIKVRDNGLRIKKSKIESKTKKNTESLIIKILKEFLMIFSRQVKEKLDFTVRNLSDFSEKDTRTEVRFNLPFEVLKT